MIKGCMDDAKYDTNLKRSEKKIWNPYNKNLARVKGLEEE